MTQCEPVRPDRSVSPFWVRLDVPLDAATGPCSLFCCSFLAWLLSCCCSSSSSLLIVSLNSYFLCVHLLTICFIYSGNRICMLQTPIFPCRSHFTLRGWFVRSALPPFVGRGWSHTPNLLRSVRTPDRQVIALTPFQITTLTREYLVEPAITRLNCMLNYGNSNNNTFSLRNLPDYSALKWGSGPLTPKDGNAPYEGT